MNTGPLPVPDVDRLLPLLRHVAELIRGGQQVDRNAVNVLCLGAGIEGADLLWAEQELQRWASILATAKQTQTPTDRNLAVRALCLRGVPEAAARLAINVVGEVQQAEEGIRADPPDIIMGELPAGTVGTAELVVRGGPGTATPGSDAMTVHPSAFGPGETKLLISRAPGPVGRLVWDKVILQSGTERIVVDVAARWCEPPEMSVLAEVDRKSSPATPSTPTYTSGPKGPATPPHVGAAIRGTSPGHPSRKHHVPHIIGGAALALIAALTFLIVRHDNNLNHASRASEQINAVELVVSGSGGQRSSLVSALDQVRSCNQPKAGIETVREITEGRRVRYGQARSLDVDAIANGAAMKEHLAAAMSASLKADEYFLTWAQRHAANDCPETWATDPDYKRGLAFSKRARVAKRAFVALWNPLAREHGLPERSESDI
ncbi:hypothetical protein ACQEVF_56910 [Nonomuraea polychroma]|uniref:hypothetical protein n=1 Tax=Nonomuraea polychroma TaxID=46176 RepID=UPI003D8C6A9E